MHNHVEAHDATVYGVEQHDKLGQVHDELFKDSRDSRLAVEKEPQEIKVKVPEEFVFGSAYNPWVRGTKETSDAVERTIRQLAAVAKSESLTAAGVTRSTDENGNKAGHDQQGRCLFVYSPETGVQTHFRYQNGEKEPSLVVAIDKKTGEQTAWMKTGGIGGSEWVGVNSKGERFHDTKPPYEEDKRVMQPLKQPLESSHRYTDAVPKDNARPNETPRNAEGDAHTRRAMTPEEAKKAALEKAGAGGSEGDAHTRRAMTPEEAKKAALEKAGTGGSEGDRHQCLPL